MMKFLHCDSLEIAREKLLDSVKNWDLKTEIIKTGSSLGRVLSEDIPAEDNVPHFHRSTMDGYAVKANDLYMAAESKPVTLILKGRVDMGQPALFTIYDGECAEVDTGGMIPDGADSVVMVEFTEEFNDEKIMFYNAVSYGENVVKPGEDVKTGEFVLSRGKVIKPQDIGVLAASGVMEIPVYRPLRIFIISTGEELISPDSKPEPGQIRDVNTPALTALAIKTGFDVTGTAIIGDDIDLLEKAVRDAMIDNEIVIISGGSSQGKMDLTRKIFDNVSQNGVFTHGIALKPGKPTILSFDNKTNTLLIGLPGHPVSAMIVFDQLVNWLLQKLTGIIPAHDISATLTCNVASSPGRQSYVPVKLRLSDAGYFADPVFGKSGLISILSKADGYIEIDRNVEGLGEGHNVSVKLF